MISFLFWYLVVSIAGLICFPLAFRVFSALPGRGFALARSLSLLIWGYLFWILGSLGLVQNNLAGILFTFFILVLVNGWSLSQTGLGEIKKWFRAQSGLVLVTELFFLAAFGVWTILRAANPEITATEKPMELAFINSILRSPSFPPNDPWLSGYAISYYYFGYVIVAMLATLTAVPAGVSFNLAVALIFALGGLGAFEIVYDLFADYLGYTG